MYPSTSNMWQCLCPHTFTHMVSDQTSKPSQSRDWTMFSWCVFLLLGWGWHLPHFRVTCIFFSVDCTIICPFFYCLLFIGTSSLHIKHIIPFVYMISLKNGGVLVCFLEQVAFRQKWEVFVGRVIFWASQQSCPRSKGVAVPRRVPIVGWEMGWARRQWLTLGMERAVTGDSELTITGSGQDRLAWL